MTIPFPTQTLPIFSAIQPADIEPALRVLLNQNRQQIQTLLAQPGPFTWDNLMQPLEEMHDTLNKTWSPIAHLHAVMETDALREAYNQTLPLLTAYHTELSQNEKLFEAIFSIFNNKNFTGLNPAQQKIIENEIRDFKLAGVHLPADKKTRMAELEQKLSQLMTHFSENLLDATQAWTLHITHPAQVDGLPPQALQLAADNAKQRNLDGYVFTLDYPSYSTAIKYLCDRKLRRQLYQAYCTRASDQNPDATQWDNSAIMNSILSARREIARLVGFDHYAAYSLATKMAKTPEEVLLFLNDLLKRSKSAADQEYKEIADFARETDAISDLQAWDVPYYSEKLQAARFQFTQEDFRPYFPVNKVLSGMFALVHKIYGITIQEETAVDVWHPQVKFFSIIDNHHQIRGGFYIDLYARAHKRDGAWMDECRIRKFKEGDIQYPVAYLTCNFMPPIHQQALLTHDDVITLFHEFGHCLHHLLTKVNYPSVAGINGVPWDAVEFPSQFMENYCWEHESLDLIAGHYQTGEPFPEALYQKMTAAKHFQTGMQMVRQLELALFDFRLHLEFDPGETGQIQRMLNDVRKQTSVMPAPAFNRFQHSFSHIFAGSYAAGYYSYKWAEVLSADAYAAFEESGVFNPVIGKRFLENILEAGGVRDPLQSFAAFRGRPPTIDALLRQSGIG